MTVADAPLLETRGLSKVYGRFTALHPTDITVRAGSIHGFLGKNGAGKSTLVKLIAGSERPSAGQILFQGEDITNLPLVRRRRLGIHLLSQHAEVVADLSIAENLLLPDYPRRGLFVDKRAMHAKARELLERYNVPFAVDQPAGSLTAPDQRRLGIVRTLIEESALVMLDEPTTALSQEERASLFDWIRALNAAGQTFVFISHFNNEIQAICDRATVLRDGQVVSDGADPRAMRSAEISELVVGSAVDEFVRRPRLAEQQRLVVSDLVTEGVGPLSFSVGAGEIVGFVGLPGSGAQESARAVAGLRPVQSGSIQLDGRALRPGDVRGALDSGMAYLTNDRHGEGIVGPMSVRESLRMGNWPSRGGLLSEREITKTYDKYHARMHFRVAGPDQPIEELSGGNQQKIILGRLLARQPTVLILDEPTLGVDVATKEEVHRLIDELTGSGLAVILLAYDTDEMVRMVDRVVAFQDGRVVGELVGDEVTADSILGRLHHQSELVDADA